MKRAVRIKKIIICVLVFCMTISMCGCSTFDSFKAEFTGDKIKDTVKIGVFEPLSGNDKKRAEEEIKGIELAHSMYPTVDGKIVELVYADNRSDIDVAKTAIKDLIAQEPLVILGSYGETNALVASSYIDKAGIPAIAITNTNPLITSTSDYYFRVSFVDTYQGTALANYVYNAKKGEKAAVVTDNNSEQSVAIEQKFVSEFTKLCDGDESSVLTLNISAEGDDYSGLLEKIRSSKIKYVFLPLAQEDAAAIIKKAHEMRTDVEFLGIDSWDYKKLVNDIGSSAASRLSFVKVSDIELPSYSDNVEAEDFLECYQSKYGDAQAPDTSVALGFDAYMLAVYAINEVGSDAGGGKIKDALFGIDKFNGVSGNFSFNSSGNPVKTMTVYSINPYTGESAAKWIVEPDGKVISVK